MIKALWLTSWYPNHLDEMNGDFVQRHAQAVSQFCKVNVIHLEADKENKLPQNIEINTYEFNDLTETIVLYKPVTGLGFIGKIITLWRYIHLFKRQVKKHIRQQGIPDIVHVHIPMKAGLIALWIKRKYKVPYVVTEHWTIYHDQSKDAYGKRSLLFKYFTKKILKNAAAFFPVSNNLGSVIQSKVVPVKFTAIPNVVNTDLFFYKPSEKTDTPFTFIHASTLNYQKNPQAILRVYHRFTGKYPGTKLVMAGEITQELKEFIQTENINTASVIFTGLVAYKAVAALMQNANALLMYSRYENLPCVILEALCCGLPVISSNVGGIGEVINNYNGILLNEYNEEFLLQAMINMYENYNSINRKNIAQQAIQEFKYSTVGKDISAMYSKIL